MGNGVRSLGTMVAVYDLTFIIECPVFFLKYKSGAQEINISSDSVVVK